MSTRTSSTQFEAMVDFMERNGDLNKPAGGPHGRLNNLSKWNDLAKALNLDPTGHSKSVEKWKKVWSDLKQNTKRKAAKINRSVSGTGGGPACKMVLTDLEQRVLGLMGSEAATGMVTIHETAPIPEDAPVAAMDSLESGVPPPLPQPGSSTSTDSPAVQFDNMIVELMRPGGSGQSTPFPTEVVDVTTASPTTRHVHTGSPARPRRILPGVPERRATPVRRPTPNRRSRARPRSHAAQPDPTAQHFLNSDNQWRDLVTKFVTESLRQREAELQQQAQWQTLFAKYIEVLQKQLEK